MSESRLHPAPPGTPTRGGARVRRPRRHPVNGVPYPVLRERARALRAEGRASLNAIAAELDVTVPCVSYWVRDLPEHEPARVANDAARVAGARLYPTGTRAFADKLIRCGIPQAERIRLAHQAAR